MNTVPYSEEVVFVITLMGGMLLGFLWDIYRLIRRYIPIGVIGTALGDVVYWLMCLYIGLNIIIFINWGTVRLYIFLGFFWGSGLYFLFLSRYILRSAFYFIDFFIKMLIKFCELIIFPIKIFIKYLKNFIKPYKIKILHKFYQMKICIERKIHEYKVSKKIRKYKKSRKKVLNRLIREKEHGKKRKSYKNIKRRNR